MDNVAKMNFPIWQIDAFSSRRFAGNPAAVVPLGRWLSDDVLRAIAAENNLPETAYFVRGTEDYELRWFTPKEEVPLCGHATLASGWVVFNRLERSWERVSFRTKSGVLTVERDNDLLALDFPVNTVRRIVDPPALVKALGGAPLEVYDGFQWLVLYSSEEEVRALAPDMAGILACGMHGVIVTAPGKDCDFVSRFFAPSAGVPEDPVTGSAHTRLTPFWAKRLGRDVLHARQVSARGGELWCELRGDRVRIAGFATPYLEGTIEV
jgi:PhzF family phenazine biosynthesis protein